MEESLTLLKAQIRAVEYQRDSANTGWARDRAALEIANAAIAEQDALLAVTRARIAELEAQVASALEPEKLAPCSGGGSGGNS